MGRNVEIKARCLQPRGIAAILSKMKAIPLGQLKQVDTYYQVRAGRLKLRTMGGKSGELIYYSRPDRLGPSLSRYSIFRTDDAATLNRQLSDALGILGVVKKMRRVYLIGQTRVHLDTVEGVGGILELEVVLRPRQTTASGRMVAGRLMKEFGIASGDLISVSNIDLIAALDRKRISRRQAKKR